MSYPMPGNSCLHARRPKLLKFAVMSFALLGALQSTAWAADKTPNELLPDTIRKAGEISVAANPSYPPFDFKNEAGESVGLEAALMGAMAEKLRVRLKFTGIEFASILPGVNAGRFDVGIGGYSNTEERRKVVEFVNYLYAVDGLVVRKGNPDKISIDKPCGKNISSSQGSYQSVNLAVLSQKCVAEGKPAIDMPVFQGTPAQVVALKSGRIQASNIDKAVGSYLVKKDPENIEEVPGVLLNASGNKLLMGFILKKGETELATALQAALNEVIKDGEYARILKDWNITDNAAVSESTLN
ncbi:MAG: transporter substrate-binding protein [Bradyrhizobium sp.]|jgi:polar amino acid transport system substrate-binding protein|nr:transporter substrate-binding protein [Bradyrhizobium sp.]MEA2866387.1 polar amino acid transport system substrate-binding protein [Bradyrhizobium sp.]